MFWWIDRRRENLYNNNNVSLDCNGMLSFLFLVERFSWKDCSLDVNSLRVYSWKGTRMTKYRLLRYIYSHSLRLILANQHINKRGWYISYYSCTELINVWNSNKFFHWVSKLHLNILAYFKHPQSHWHRVVVIFFTKVTTQYERDLIIQYSK